MSTSVYLALDGPDPYVDQGAGYLVFPGPDGTHTGGLKINLNAHRPEQVQQQLALALDAVNELVGFSAPETVLVDDLDATYVGWQFRSLVYRFSDGAETWGPWQYLTDVRGSAFGNSVELHREGGFDEVDEGAAVQVRRRLSLDEVNDQAKAVA